MGDMADMALDHMMDEDEAQFQVLGHSNVFQFRRRPQPTCCSKCGGTLVLRSGKFGSFLGCDAFPACKGGTTYSIRDQNELTPDDMHEMNRD